MSNYNFNYAFNISGNCNAVVAEISGEVENLQRNLRATTSMWDTFEGKILAFNQLTQYVQNLGQAMNETLAPGAALDVLKNITGFIDDLQPLCKVENDGQLKTETFCDFIFSSVRNYYRGLREEYTINRMQRLFGDNSAIQNNVISNWLYRRKGESADGSGESRETISASHPFIINYEYGNLISQGIYLNQRQGLLSFLEQGNFLNTNAVIEMQRFIGDDEKHQTISTYDIINRLKSNIFGDEKGLLIKDNLSSAFQMQRIYGRNEVYENIDNESLKFNSVGLISWPKSLISFFKQASELNEEPNENIDQNDKEKVKPNANRSDLQGRWSSIWYGPDGQRIIGTLAEGISRKAQQRRQENIETDRRAQILIEKLVDKIEIYHRGSDNDDVLVSQITRVVEESMLEILRKAAEEC